MQATEQVTVGRTAWEMAQWELHYLRRLLSTLIVDAMLAGREAKERKHAYDEAMLRALREPEFRRRLG